MTHQLGLLDIWGYKHTFGMCNTYCFPLQQWLHECVSLLHYMYIACHVYYFELSWMLIRVRVLSAWDVLSYSLHAAGWLMAVTCKYIQPMESRHRCLWQWGKGSAGNSGDCHDTHANVFFTDTNIYCGSLNVEKWKHILSFKTWCSFYHCYVVLNVFFYIVTF